MKETMPTVPILNTIYVYRFETICNVFNVRYFKQKPAIHVHRHIYTSNVFNFFCT